MSGLALVGHQFRYDQKAFWRNPASVFFTVMFPVVLLLIFATVFGSQTVDVRGGIKTTTYYVPAIITLSVISATMQSLAMSLVIAREDGRLKRGRGTPMPPWVFIAGRIGNSIVVALMMLALLAVDRRRPLRGRRSPGIACRRSSSPSSSAPRPSAASGSRSPRRSPPRTPRRRSSTPCCCRSTSSPVSSSPTTSCPNGVIHFADIFPIRHFFEAFFDAYVPANGMASAAVSWGNLAIVAIWGVVGLLLAIRFFRWTPRSG